MLINQEQIAVATRYKETNTACIKKWLERNGVPFFTAKDGHVVTTLEAFNKALIGEVKKENLEDVQF